MSIRAKFFALAGIILAIFGIVVGVLSIMQAATAHKIEDIVAHHQKLRRILADVDVATDEYELRAERLRRQPDRPVAELRAATAAIERVGAAILQDFDRLRTALDEAVTYNHDDPDDLRVLSRVQGALPLLARQVEPFIAVGKAVTDAVLSGRTDDARTLALGFTRFEDAFGPDLAMMRDTVTTLTEDAAEAIHADQRLNARFSFILFIIASAIGIAISGIGSEQVVAALRRLLASARAIEQGQTDVPALVTTTRDEVGELARAFNRMVAELRDRERIKETFGKFVDPRIVTRLIGTSDGNPEPAERKMVTIFFSDIRGFSNISEQLTAAAMVNLLNGYFTAVAGEIRRHNGIIDKYIGDAVMAFWCSPFSAGDDHALDGCKAAVDQLGAIAEFRKRLPEITGLRRDPPVLGVRMGIATGEAVVGAIGSPSARSYTVIGDTVNLASRLEGVNKLYGTTVIIAEDTFRLAQNAIEARELDIVTVAGKSEKIRIYELMTLSGELDAIRSALREQFTEGLAAYRRQDWDAAEQCFTACRNLVAEDGPSTVFLARIAAFRRDPPPAGWDAVWHLTAK
jgi:adenylate cyclase